MSDLEVHDREGARVVTLRGDLDVLTAPDVAARLPSLVDGTRSLVLDLSALDFFDSSGVRLVDELARTCAQHGASWWVVSPEGSVSHRVLRLVGMLGPQVVADVASALSSP